MFWWNWKEVRFLIKVVTCKSLHREFKLPILFFQNANNFHWIVETSLHKNLLIGIYNSWDPLIGTTQKEISY